MAENQLTVSFLPLVTAGAPAHTRNMIALALLLWLVVLGVLAYTGHVADTRDARYSLGLVAPQPRPRAPGATPAP
jgi:hypothetical protein